MITFLLLKQSIELDENNGIFAKIIAITCMRNYGRNSLF